MIFKVLFALVELRHRLHHRLHPDEPCLADAVEATTVPASTMHRQMLYDVFEEPELVAEVVGLPPISAELVDMERRAHMTRMAEIAPLLPLLIQQAEFLALTAAKMQEHQYPDSITEEERERTVAVFTTLLKSGLISGTASAVDMGLLQVNGIAVVHQ